MVGIIKEAGIPDWAGRLVLQLQGAFASVSTDRVPANLNLSPSYANDAAAAAGNVPLGGIYRNGSAVQVRVT